MGTLSSFTLAGLTAVLGEGVSRARVSCREAVGGPCPPRETPGVSLSYCLRRSYQDPELKELQQHRVGWGPPLSSGLWSPGVGPP